MIMLPLMSFAQSDDFGVWTSISADKKVNKKFSVGIEAEMRTRDNSEKIDRWSFGVDWKITKKHAVGAYYLYQAVHDDDDDNEPNLHVLGLEYKFKF